jgi:hypothetical protein
VRCCSGAISWLLLEVVIDLNSTLTRYFYGMTINRNA